MIGGLRRKCRLMPTSWKRKLSDWPIRAGHWPHRGWESSAIESYKCPDSEIRNISISPFSEFRNRKDTSNVLIPSVVLVSKFARRSISECSELRNHDTRWLGRFPSWEMRHELVVLYEIG